MSDVFTIVQGNLYDPGQAYDFWYMVISDNNYNRTNNQIICCFVKLFDSSKDLNNNDIIFEYNDIKYKIITDSITNHYSKKLCRYQYKGTLSEDIVNSVLNKIKFMLGFNNLITLDEARKILDEKEIELKAKYGAYGIPSNKTVTNTVTEPEPEVVPVIIPPVKSSNIKLSKDDEQKAFARQMANLPLEEQEIEDFTSEEAFANVVDVVTETKPFKKPVKKKKSKKRTNAKRNNLIYNNLEQFISDYRNKDAEEVMKKYKVSDKKALYKFYSNIKINHPNVFNSIPEKVDTIKEKTYICEDFILDYYSLTDTELISKYHLKNNKTSVRNAIAKAKEDYVRQGGNLKDLKDIAKDGNRKQGRKKVAT